MVKDIRVRKVNADFTDKNIYVVSYYKVGHNATRAFSTPIDEFNKLESTTNLQNTILQNQADQIIFVIRHPTERLLSGIKERVLSDNNFKLTKQQVSNTWQGEYISTSTALTILHDKIFWSQQLDLSNNLLQFDNDPHTTNYLETIEQLHSQTIDGDILHEIIDIKHMNYYFAQQGLRCYQVNPSPFSHLINNVIAEVLMEKPEVLQRIRQHIQPELEIYNKLIAYDTRQTRYETEENLDETDYFNQLKNLVGF